MKLSVIIPAFNRAHLIGETLRSIFLQTRPAAEIIVVDDGSTDGTADAALQAANAWKASTGGLKADFKVIRQANAGPAAARNTGFRVSRGELIHFFDSDDLAAPNKHMVQAAALEASGAEIAYGPWVKGRFNSGTTFVPSNQVLQQKGLPPEADLVKSLLTNWSVVPHAALFRRSIVEKAGGFPEDLFGPEDQQMFLACLLTGARVVHTPSTIEFYREGDAGKITESKSGEARRFREWARFLLKARASCLQKKVDPVDWFGFRQRVWEASEDLDSIGEVNSELQAQLKPLFKGRAPTGFYHWRRQWHRWHGGLQARLTGGRAVREFQIGPLTLVQLEQLNLLGYQLGSAAS